MAKQYKAENKCHNGSIKYFKSSKEQACVLRRIIKEELVETDLEGEIEFQKEKCGRVFDGRDNKVFPSKVVAHFPSNGEIIKRASGNKSTWGLNFFEFVNAPLSPKFVKPGHSPKQTVQNQFKISRLPKEWNICL